MKKIQTDPHVAIPARVDDMDLTVNPFRVYVHLLVRGDATYESIAEKCLRPTYKAATPEELRTLAAAAVQELQDHSLVMVFEDAAGAGEVGS